MNIRVRFVEFIPESLEEGVLYVSKKYYTASHKCFCGCGEEVVTPITPTDWTLYEQNGKVSLRPSVGNWRLKCRSHYYITNNQIQWMGDMSQSKILEGRRIDRLQKQKYYTARKQKARSAQHQSLHNPHKPVNQKEQMPSLSRSLLDRMWHFLKNVFGI